MVCRTELAGCLPHFAPVHGWETRTGACVFRQIQLGNLCGSRGGETGNDVSVSPRESSSVGFCILHWQRKRGTVKPGSTLPVTNPVSMFRTDPSTTPRYQPGRNWKNSAIFIAKNRSSRLGC